MFSMPWEQQLILNFNRRAGAMIDNRVTGRTVSPRVGNTILLRRTGAMLLLSGLVTACASPQGGRGPAVGPAPAASAAPAVQPAQAAVAATAKKGLSLEPGTGDPHGGVLTAGR